jgi:hypothetical protein
MTQPNKKPIDCTFRVILLRTRHGRRFVAVAWNYPGGVLVTSGASVPSYGEARDQLDVVAAEMGLCLRWFDGEFEHNGGTDDAIYPRSFVQIAEEAEEATGT